MFTGIPATGTLTTLHTQLLLTSWVSGSCLFPSVMYFQTRQVTIHRKRFLHLLFFACVWCCLFFFLSCSSLSTSEGNKLCYVHAAKGRAQCRTQRLVENHRPQAGRWPARPDCFQQSMCLCSHAHLRKIFFTFYICLCLQTYATFF